VLQVLLPTTQLVSTAVSRALELQVLLPTAQLLCTAVNRALVLQVLLPTAQLVCTAVNRALVLQFLLPNAQILSHYFCPTKHLTSTITDSTPLCLSVHYIITVCPCTSFEG
jgi:hypothetical protein